MIDIVILSDRRLIIIGAEIYLPKVVIRVLIAVEIKIMGVGSKMKSVQVLFIQA